MSRFLNRERVILVHINFPSDKMEEDLEEFQELAISSDAEIAQVITGTRRVPDSKYFVGSGKAEEIRQAVTITSVQLVIFNHELSPAQERNLERLLKCRVIDRTGLILDIFALRARSFEGQLQVELALLKHLSTRLIRGWTHLERQRGGIGLRGPGETQLETDRRLIRNRIKYISARLVKIRKQRQQSRGARQKALIPTVSLVGYTNAGKSTLFNYLTGASVYVADKLFATLDPTLRRIDIPQIGPVIMADTVGFIRHLPHDLIEAFHATLEEVSSADLLLHIVDCQDEKKLLHIKEVDKVLESIGAGDVPRLLVYNKIDQLNDEINLKEVGQNGKIKRIAISAKTGFGIDMLIESIRDLLAKQISEHQLILSPKQGRLRAILYKRGSVQSEIIDKEGNFHLTVRLPQVELERLFR